MKIGLKCRVAAVVITALLLCSCGVGNKAGRTIGLQNDPPFLVHINVSPAANKNNPVPMDLVLVLDKKIMEAVAKLPAKDWFERRMQIQRDAPGKTEIVSWEWVPGQSAGPIAVHVNKHTKGAFVFAGYLTPGDHRASIDVRQPVVIQLQEERMMVQAVK